VLLLVLMHDPAAAASVLHCERLKCRSAKLTALLSTATSRQRRRSFQSADCSKTAAH
jgi:hypothetical protein